MDTYIVLDLEWNQSPLGKEGTVPGLPFEIIEIGAVKLDRELNIIDTFRRAVKPQVYQRLHFMVQDVVHTSIEELKKTGTPFPEAAGEFLKWCYHTAGVRNHAINETPTGEAGGSKMTADAFKETDHFEETDKPIFCTWGEMDLTELQLNMRYYGMESPFPYPFLYYDVQKLYGLLTEGTKKPAAPLDKAVRSLGIRESADQFHHALDDALYTAKVMQKLELKKVEKYLSLDYFRIPGNKDEELYLIFPDYSKYVSRAFVSKEAMMADKTVSDMICYRCNRMLRKKIRWFSSGQRQYLCLSVCPEHGYVKGKIRVKHTSDGRLYAVKTIKLTTPETFEAMSQKKQDISTARNERNKRLRKKGH